MTPRDALVAARSTFGKLLKTSLDRQIPDPRFRATAQLELANAFVEADAALASPLVSEVPVAWRWMDNLDDRWIYSELHPRETYEGETPLANVRNIVPLYASPTADNARAELAKYKP